MGCLCYVVPNECECKTVWHDVCQIMGGRVFVYMQALSMERIRVFGNCDEESSV